MGVPKTSDRMEIKIKTQNPSQEPPVPIEAPNKDLKDMDVLCTIKIKMKSKNFDHGYIQDQGQYLIQDRYAKPSQEPIASSKAPN